MEPHARRGSPMREPPPTAYAANPVALLADLADSPTAIGVYNLIGRRYAIRQTPVPLSANDVMRFDATLTYGAAVRALERLTSSGWMIEQRRTGWKSTYVPTWGRVKGVLVPWQIGTARNGRPAHQHYVTIDVRILDTYIGRIEPHERHPAQITRYLTAPLLSLRDVGVYALARSGRRVHTSSLERWGLLRGDSVAEPMSDDAIIAYASQITLHDPTNTCTLTEHGMRVLGPVQPTPSHIGTSTTLFFVDKEVIGRMIGDTIRRSISTPITPDHIAEHHSTASESRRLQETQRTPADTCIESIPSISCISTPTAVGARVPLGTSIKKPVGNNAMASPLSAEHSRLKLSDSPAVDLLRTLNVRPAQIAELAQIPVEHIQLAIQDAQSRPQLRDQAGWVVNMLRDWRDHGWHIRPPQSTTEVDWGAIATAYAYATEPDALVTVDTPPGAFLDAAASTAALRSYLCAAVERRYRPVIACLAVEIHDQVAIVSCETVQHHDTAITMLAPAIRSWFSQYDVQGIVQFVLDPPAPIAGSAAHTPDGDSLPCPAWLSEAQWQQLGIVLRGILHGSTMQHGTIVGRTPHLDHLIHTRYRDEVERLRLTIAA